MYFYNGKIRIKYETSNVYHTYISCTFWVYITKTLINIYIPIINSKPFTVKKNINLK